MDDIPALTHAIAVGAVSLAVFVAMCLTTRWFNTTFRTIMTDDLSESDETVVEATLLRSWRRSFHHLDHYARHGYCTCCVLTFASVALSSATPWVRYMGLGVYPLLGIHVWKVFEHVLGRHAAQDEIQHWEKVRHATRVR